jgi:hypothetical protein
MVLAVIFADVNQHGSLELARQLQAEEEDQLAEEMAHMGLSSNTDERIPDDNSVQHIPANPVQPQPPPPRITSVSVLASPTKDLQKKRKECTIM